MTIHHVEPTYEWVPLTFSQSLYLVPALKVNAEMPVIAGQELGCNAWLGSS